METIIYMILILLVSSLSLLIVMAGAFLIKGGAEILEEGFKRAFEFAGKLLITFAQNLSLAIKNKK